MLACNDPYCKVCPGGVCQVCNASSYLHEYSRCSEVCDVNNGYYVTDHANGTITCLRKNLYIIYIV